jgi:hypothetical protein
MVKPKKVPQFALRRPCRKIAGMILRPARVSRLSLVTIAFVLAAVLQLPSVALGQQGSGRMGGPRLRARPPAKWDSAAAGHFFADAFAELDRDGPRPDFSRVAKAADSQAAATSPAASSAAAGDGWQALVSADTLVDEIKSKKKLVDEAVAKKGTFIRGGYLEARNALSSIAAAFGVIAAFPGEVRWKDQAAKARDTFGRVADDCNKGDDKTFVSATKASEDLEKLLSGGTIDGQVVADVKWHRIAARSPLMWRLEMAEKAAREATASPAAFGKEAERLLHEAEIIAMIGEFVQQPDFEFFDDDTYKGYASAMRDAAVAAAAAVKKGDHAAAVTALGAISTACTDCHGEYR